MKKILKKKIISFLKKRKKNKRDSLYPYKKGTQNYENWKKYYSGATGLFSVLIYNKNRNFILKFINSLKLLELARVGEVF